VALTGGAVFDYVSGDLQRAPRWMTDNGMEWLGRLLIEPRRFVLSPVVSLSNHLPKGLWKRYLAS